MTHFMFTPVVMLGIFIIFLLKISLTKSFYIPTVDFINDTAEEVQNALCTITTNAMEATANATVTRQLKGVCTSSELNLKLDKLQTKILQEIDGIKYILELNGFKGSDDRSNSGYVEYNVHKPDNTTIILPRTEEILMYNNTAIDSVEGTKYFYYWKIQDVRQLLGKRDIYKSSPVFQILGHNLRLQFYPNHLRNKYFGIELRPDSHGFIKKHKISILNQLNYGSDIESVILYGIKGDRRIFRVLEKKLDKEGFVIENSIIVRLEILLNS